MSREECSTRHILPSNPYSVQSRSAKPEIVSDISSHPRPSCEWVSCAVIFLPNADRAQCGKMKLTRKKRLKNLVIHYYKV